LPRTQIVPALPSVDTFRQDGKPKSKLSLPLSFSQANSGHPGQPLFTNGTTSIGPQRTEIDVSQCKTPADDSGSKQLNGYFLQKSTVAIQAEST
jgi:hypothetical protein